MPPQRRPLRPRPEAPAVPKKKPPVLLLAGLGAAALGLILVIFVALGSKNSEPPPDLGPKEPPKPAEPEYSVLVHQTDGGKVLQVTLLAYGKDRGKPADYALLDGEGKEYAGAKADPRELFHREVQKEPGAIAVAFTLPGTGASLEVRGPGGRKVPAVRPAGKECFRTGSGPFPYEGWSLTLSGSLTAESDFDLEVKARRVADDAPDLDPKRFFLLTDEGASLSPEVKGTSPLRLRYKAVPKTARELRLQTVFRGPRPEYVVFPVAAKGDPTASTPAPDPSAPPKPDSPAPPKPDAGLRASFEAKLAQDPVAAFRSLAENPTEEARGLARAAMARVVRADLDAGLKAFAENKADLVEKHLTRAALLAEAYSPELSRQVMRMLFLMKQPRKTPTGCAPCKGAGAAPCGGCKGGLTTGNCPRCEARGQVNCLLCDGAGTMDHHGYKGTLVLTLERDTRAKDEFGRSGVLPAQTVTYQMKPCAGGSFPLHTENVLAKGGARPPQNVSQPCSKFWNEMKMFVFSGKAKIKITSSRGQLVPFSSAASRRFFADYEICKSGHVPCDRCAGRKTDVCSVCAGKGQAQRLCTTCEGTSLQACAACKGYGDASWLSKLLPSAPELQRQFLEQAVAIRDWLDERARLATRREDLARRLEEAKKGLDPTAKLTEDVVDILCPRCKANGSECEECWATGRREYYQGTPQYERYALAKRLERQVKEASQPSTAGPSLVAFGESEPAAGAAAGPAKPPPSIPSPVRNPGAPVAIPKTVEEIIKKADELHETGKAHLEKAKATTDQAVWMDEAVKALNDLKNAQTLYATAQEKLDEAGAAVPKELLLKFRTNMQALIMARRTAP
jgi:hypothetical protein